MAARTPVMHQAERLIEQFSNDEAIAEEWLLARYRQEVWRHVEGIAGTALIVGGLYLVMHGQRVRKSGLRKNLFRGI